MSTDLNIDKDQNTLPLNEISTNVVHTIQSKTVLTENTK